MRLAVLGARGRDGPGAIIEIDFFPRYRTDFLTALTGDDQELNNRSVWIANIACSRYNTH